MRNKGRVNALSYPLRNVGFNPEAASDLAAALGYPTKSHSRAVDRPAVPEAVLRVFAHEDDPDDDEGEEAA